MSKFRSDPVREAVLAFLLILCLSIRIYQSLAPDTLTHRNQDELTRIAPAPANFSFVVMADTRDNLLTYLNLKDQVNAEKILFSIHLGDLIYKADFYRYRFLVKQLRKLAKPVLTVPGNHELSGGGGKGRERYRHYFGELEYSFAEGNCYFIMVDNTDGYLDSKQMAWLRNELEKSKSYSYRFVCAHVPLYDPREGRNYCMKDKNQVKALNQLLDEYRVTMLFVSHIHAYYRGTWGKTPYIITGGGGAPLSSNTGPDHQFNHYLRADVSDSGVTFHVIKVNPAGSEILDKFLYNTCLFHEGFLLDTLIVISAGLLIATFLKRRNQARRKEK